MTPLLKKLNFKGESVIYILSSPEELEHHFSNEPDSQIVKEIDAASTVQFAIAFAKTLAEIEHCANCFRSRSFGDATIWIAYPKANSKKYKCEFNRDNGWQAMGEAGFEPVRQVAIDQDWSALRFRRVEFIKTMTRSFAMTEAGKAKSSK
ncbi:hypothetical protein CCB80_06975 [Armatimonadetes bacterium Uphvl-Ar1]|nr:hypothetical protein CCB80_06975 [Armatimonadetes bacterium Uphvl-Ar1]